MTVNPTENMIDHLRNNNKIMTRSSPYHLPFLMRFLSLPHLEQPGKGGTLYTFVERETTDDR
jgi:hypothetical protein